MPLWVYPAIPLAAIAVSVQVYILWNARQQRRRELQRLVDEIIVK